MMASKTLSLTVFGSNRISYHRGVTKKIVLQRTPDWRIDHMHRWRSVWLTNQQNQSLANTLRRFAPYTWWVHETINSSANYRPCSSSRVQEWVHPLRHVYLIEILTVLWSSTCLRAGLLAPSGTSPAFNNGKIWVTQNACMAFVIDQQHQPTNRWLPIGNLRDSGVVFFMFCVPDPKSSTIYQQHTYELLLISVCLPLLVQSTLK